MPKKNGLPTMRELLKRHAEELSDKANEIFRLNQTIKALTDTADEANRSYIEHHNTIQALRTQLADATRKLEEVRKNERRYIWLRDIGDDTWVPLAKRPQVLFTHQIDDAIDQAIEQGKGGDDE
jgi:septal ring factor EnvC (AmiA/AmiB activator)